MKHAALALTLVACGIEGPAPLTFEQFVDQAYREPGSGFWVVNGDELVESEDQFADYYQSYLDSFDGVGNHGAELTVNTVNGTDDLWPPETARNLTYCVTRSGVGAFTASEYSFVVSALNAAAASWESSANVKFVHVESLDDSCSPTSAVVFNVSHTCGSPFLARAFFPSYSRAARELLIDCTTLPTPAPWTLGGVLRHELGHVLGFRHEHVRPETGTCFEPSNWRGVTTYDSASVMHYPQCRGTQTADLVLTALDRQGAGLMYPGGGVVEHCFQGRYCTTTAIGSSGTDLPTYQQPPTQMTGLGIKNLEVRPIQVTLSGCAGQGSFVVAPGAEIVGHLHESPMSLTGSCTNGQTHISATGKFYALFSHTEDSGATYAVTEPGGQQWQYP